jgi:hypothetical protein
MFYLNQFLERVIPSEVEGSRGITFGLATLGSARASRAHFGAFAEMLFKRKVRDGEGAIANTRGRVRSPDYPPKAFKPVISRPMIKV